MRTRLSIFSIPKLSNKFINTFYKYIFEITFKLCHEQEMLKTTQQYDTILVEIHLKKVGE